MAAQTATERGRRWRERNADAYKAYHIHYRAQMPTAQRDGQVWREWRDKTNENGRKRTARAPKRSFNVKRFLPAAKIDDFLARVSTRLAVGGTSKILETLRVMIDVFGYIGHITKTDFCRAMDISLGAAASRVITVKVHLDVLEKIALDTGIA